MFECVRLLLFASLVVLSGYAQASAGGDGCASRGGPGYRDVKGKCVGHKVLYSRCGVPPTTRCTFEGKMGVQPSAIPPDWTPAQHAAWLVSRTPTSDSLPAEPASGPTERSTAAPPVSSRAAQPDDSRRAPPPPS